MTYVDPLDPLHGPPVKNQWVNPLSDSLLWKMNEKTELIKLTFKMARHLNKTFFVRFEASIENLWR